MHEDTTASRHPAGPARRVHLHTVQHGWQTLTSPWQGTPPRQGLQKGRIMKTYRVALAATILVNVSADGKLEAKLKARDLINKHLDNCDGFNLRDLPVANFPRIYPKNTPPVTSRDFIVEDVS
jgi:hypothetical protein